ncbi:hypothetical protein B14911_26780 [Bacillus sp. NRRL B-14911]|nr:hypothetical protein B14911_26780 [Bacillus sp. NRRL B-14911]
MQLKGQTFMIKANQRKSIEKGRQL